MTAPASRSLRAWKASFVGESLQCSRPGSCLHVGGSDVVLQDHRDAVQGSSSARGAPFGIESRRLVSGGRVDQDERVQLRPGVVIGSDPRQREVDQLDRRQLTALYRALELGIVASKRTAQGWNSSRRRPRERGRGTLPVPRLQHVARYSVRSRLARLPIEAGKPWVAPPGVICWPPDSRPSEAANASPTCRAGEFARAEVRLEVHAVSVRTSAPDRTPAGSRASTVNEASPRPAPLVHRPVDPEGMRTSSLSWASMNIVGYHSSSHLYSFRSTGFLIRTAVQGSRHAGGWARRDDLDRPRDLEAVFSTFAFVARTPPCARPRTGPGLSVERLAERPGRLGRPVGTGPTTRVSSELAGPERALTRSVAGEGGATAGLMALP